MKKAQTRGFRRPEYNIRVIIGRCDYGKKTAKRHSTLNTLSYKSRPHAASIGRTARAESSIQTPSGFRVMPKLMAINADPPSPAAVTEKNRRNWLNEFRLFTASQYLRLRSKHPEYRSTVLEFLESRDLPQTPA